MLFRYIILYYFSIKISCEINVYEIYIYKTHMHKSYTLYILV